MKTNSFLFTLANRLLRVYNVYIIYIHLGDNMEIIISNNVDIPIYQQVYNQIKSAIINNQLQENELLPSIRNLAKDLKISVITTRRAYEELERDGYIYTSIGKGSFVKSLNKELIRENGLKEIESHLQKITEIAKLSQITKAEIIAITEIIMEEK